MKTVLITGASRGIGRETAIKFAREGWRVAINYNQSLDAATSLKRELDKMGSKSELFCADIANCLQIEKMVDEVNFTLGSIDVLVNNAGIALPQGLLTDFADSDARRVFDTNVIGMINCTKAVIPQMVQKKSGAIVNVSSIWGEIGASCEVIYSASKAAVTGFTKALAKELGPSGIRVNCVSPGFIDTDMNSHISEEDRADFVQSTALGRVGRAKEVADAIYFLATDGASYITGQNLTIDGGL